MTIPREKLSRLGARLGNWNDRHFGADTKADQTRLWRTLDRFAGWLYVLPEAAHRDGRIAESDGDLADV